MCHLLLFLLLNTISYTCASDLPPAPTLKSKYSNPGGQTTEQRCTVETFDPRAFELHKAISQEKEGVVRQLLATGISPDAYERQQTPLYAAAGTFNIAIVKILLENGATVNGLSRYHWNAQPDTALHRVMNQCNLARSKGFDHMLNIITCLIEHGADPMIKGDKDKLPLDIIAKDTAISNKAAFPIIATLLEASKTHTDYQEAKNTAACFARTAATKTKSQCVHHANMFIARAAFIKSYPEIKDVPSDDCDEWPLPSVASDNAPKMLVNDLHGFMIPAHSIEPLEGDLYDYKVDPKHIRGKKPSEFN